MDQTTRREKKKTQVSSDDISRAAGPHLLRFLGPVSEGRQVPPRFCHESRRLRKLLVALPQPSGEAVRVLLHMGGMDWVGVH